MPRADLLHRDAFTTLQTAEINEDYYRSRAATFGRMDAWTRILSAVMSAATIASILAAAPWVLHLFAALTLVATTANNVLALGERARTRRELAAKWSAVAGRLIVLEHNLRTERSHESAFLDTQEDELLAILSEGGRLQNEDTEPRHDATAIAAQARVRAHLADKIAA